MSKRQTSLAEQLKTGELLVQWPTQPVSDAAGDVDLGAPLDQLLVDLDIKGSDEEARAASGIVPALRGTPYGVAIIEAGATAASKGWALFLTAVGGGTALWASVTDFWRVQDGAVQGTIVLAVALVVVACVLGIAAILYGDVRARGDGAAAQYEARALVAAAFLAGATQRVAAGPVHGGPANLVPAQVPPSTSGPATTGPSTTATPTADGAAGLVETLTLLFSGQGPKG